MDAYRTRITPDAHGTPGRHGKRPGHATSRRGHAPTPRSGLRRCSPTEVGQNPNVRLSQDWVPQVTGPMVPVTGYLSWHRRPYSEKVDVFATGVVLPLGPLMIEEFVRSCVSMRTVVRTRCGDGACRRHQVVFEVSFESGHVGKRIISWRSSTLGLKLSFVICLSRFLVH